MTIVIQVAGVGTAIARANDSPGSVVATAAPGARTETGVEASVTERTRVPKPALPSPPPGDDRDDDAGDDATAADEPAEVSPVIVASPPTPTAPPAPPPVAVAPAPAPPTTVSPPPPTTSPASIEERFLRIVPASWRAAIPVRLSVIPGATSWANHDGTIQIAATHAAGDPTLLDVVIAHEFGHLVAYRYGTRAYAGSAPAGWPAATHNPAEHWADCVQQVWLGVVRPSHGLPACGGDQLEWARQFLQAGPPS